MAEEMMLESLFLFNIAKTAKSVALSPLLMNCNQYFHNIAALSAVRPASVLHVHQGTLFILGWRLLPNEQT